MKLQKIITTVEMGDSKFVLYVVEGRPANLTMTYNGYLAGRPQTISMDFESVPATKGAFIANLTTLRDFVNGLKEVLSELDVEINAKSPQNGK